MNFMTSILSLLTSGGFMFFGGSRYLQIRHEDGDTVDLPGSFEEPDGDAHMSDGAASTMMALACGAIQATSDAAEAAVAWFRRVGGFPIIIDGLNAIGEAAHMSIQCSSSVDSMRWSGMNYAFRISQKAIRGGIRCRNVILVLRVPLHLSDNLVNAFVQEFISMMKGCVLTGDVAVFLVHENSGNLDDKVVMLLEKLMLKKGITPQVISTDGYKKPEDRFGDVQEWPCISIVSGGAVIANMRAAVTRGSAISVGLPVQGRRLPRAMSVWPTIKRRKQCRS